MDSTRKAIRVFDAFPKTPPSDQVGSYRGSYSTLLTYFFMLFMIWVQIGGYIDGYIDHQYSVDESIRTTIELNIDIIVKMPCKYLDTNVKDITEDRYMAEEVLNFEGLNLPEMFWRELSPKVPMPLNLDHILADSLEASFYTKGSRLNLEANSCRIYGSIPINRVKGDFHITAEGHAYFGMGMAPKESINFSHYIGEFSFGTFYPYIENTLDSVSHVTKDNRHTYHYNLKIIPMVFGKLGHYIETTQYSAQLFETSKTFYPGIFIQYDFDPIKMTTSETRLTFLQFVIRLVNIIAGLWIICKSLYHIMEKLIIVFLGKEFARRGDEKKGGLLDDPVEDFETI